MMLGTDHTPRGRQTGSILIMTLVVLVGIGTITAGLMTILQQRAVTLTEDIRMLRGLGVADSYRLALIAGREDAQVQTDLGEALPGDAFVESDGTTYTGAIEAAANRWGYRFIYNRTGVPGSGGGEVPQTPPANYIDSGELKACKQDANDCGFNNGSEPDPTDQVYFQGDTDIKFNPNADIELEGLIVNGNLTIEVSSGCGKGKNPCWLCVSDRFEVGGTITGLDDLNDPPQDCQTPSSGLNGNDEWTFQTAN